MMNFNFNLNNLQGLGLNQVQSPNHIYFISGQGGFNLFGCSSDIPNRSLYLLNKDYKFNIFELMPKNFKITTKNGSNFFNIEFIKDSSQVINEFLKDNPKIFQYHLEINDEKNVLGKFEQMFQGKLVYFDEDDIPTYQKIVDTLKITRCPNYKKADPIPNTFSFNWNLLSDSVSSGAKINEISFELYLKTEAPKSFTISTKKKEYKCNIFGILSSKILLELITRDPTIDRYDYDFEDEFDEFQSICDLFNFQTVKITPNNMNLLKDVADDLQITYILDDLDKIISELDKISGEIDEQQSTVELIDELFDWIYNIKEKTVESVRNSIIESNWSKSDENVQELAAFILQATKTDFILHPYLADLIEQLNQNANESNSLKILLPFIIKHLMFSFSQDKTNCSFIYNLFKKGFISREDIIKKIKDPNPLDQFRSSENIYLWFLPELVEEHLYNDNIVTSSNFGIPINAIPINAIPINAIGANAIGVNANINNVNNWGIPTISNSNNEVTNFPSFIKLFYPNNLESYKKMRDEGEPHHELTKALRHDNVDIVQSILSRSTDDLTKKTIPYNIYEEFVPNGTTRYINYAAAYGSIKCFKFLLLNHHDIDDETFRMAVFGGNTEIIQIVDKTKITPSPSNPLANQLPITTNIQPVGIISKIIPSIKKNQNKIFDWIIENKFNAQDKTESNLLELIISCIKNGNAHAMIGIIDNGFDIMKDQSFSNSLIQLAAQNGFYRLAQLFYNLTHKKQEKQQQQLQGPNLNNPFGLTSAFATSLGSINPNALNSVLLGPINIENFVSFGNLDIFKLGVNFFPDNNDLEKALSFAVKRDYPKIIDYFFDELGKKKKIFSLGGIQNSLSNSVSQPSCSLFDHLMEKYKETCPLIFNQYKTYNTLIPIACNNQNLEATKKLIKLSLEINPKEDFSFPFIRAAASGSVDICQYFIDQNLQLDYDQLSNNVFDLGSVTKDLFILVVDKAKPSLKDKFLLRSLTPAIQKRNIELVDYLLSQNVPYGSILFDAVNTHDVEVVNTILKYNSKPSFVNRKNENGSALFTATRNNDIDIIRRLLKVDGIDINIVDQRNYSMLMHVCESNKRDALKEFLDLGLANTNMSSPSNGNSLLMQAIEMGNYEIAKLLINYDKTDINAQNYQELTALTIATSRNALSIIDILINNEKFNPEDSRLDYAFYISSGEASNHLINAKGLDVNYRNVQKNQNAAFYDINTYNSLEIYDTPLMHAADYNNINIIDLIANHPTFDKDKSRLESAIFISVRKNNEAIFKKLIELDGRNINEIKSKKIGIYANALSYKSAKIITELLNNPQFKPDKLDIPMTFIDIFNFREDEIYPLIKTICSYCNEHDGLFDFSKPLPGGRTLLTLINRSNIQNITDIVNLFAENGANPNEPDKFGIYPLENAMRINYYDLVVALINLNKIDYGQKIPINKPNVAIGMPFYPNPQNAQFPSSIPPGLNLATPVTSSAFGTTGTTNTTPTGLFGTGTGFNFGTTGATNTTPTGLFGSNGATNTTATGFNFGTTGFNFGTTGTGFNFGTTGTSSALDTQSNSLQSEKEDDDSKKEKFDETEKKEADDDSEKEKSEESEEKETNDSTKEKSEETEKKETDDSSKENSGTSSFTFSLPPVLPNSSATPFAFNFEPTTTSTTPFTFGTSTTPSAFDFGTSTTPFNTGISKSPTYKTYLHLAAVCNNSDILMEFINRRLIDINVTDDQGNTPLIDACRSRQRENVESILLVDNCDFLHRNKSGQDALMIAKQIYNNMYGPPNNSSAQSLFGQSAFGTPVQNAPVQGIFGQNTFNFNTSLQNAFGPTTTSFSTEQPTKKDEKDKDKEEDEDEEEIKDKDEYSKKILDYLNPPNLNFGTTTVQQLNNINTTTTTTTTLLRSPGISSLEGNNNNNNIGSFNFAPLNFGALSKINMKNIQTEVESAVLNIFKNATPEEVEKLKKALSEITERNSKDENNEEKEEEEKKKENKVEEIKENDQKQKDENERKDKKEEIKPQIENERKFIKDEIKQKQENERKFIKDEIKPQIENERKFIKDEIKENVQKQKGFNFNFEDIEEEEEENEDDLYQLSPYELQDRMMQQNWQNIMQMNYIRQANFERQMKRNANLIQSLQNQSLKKKKKKKHSKK